MEIMEIDDLRHIAPDIRFTNEDPGRRDRVVRTYGRILATWPHGGGYLGWIDRMEDHKGTLEVYSYRRLPWALYCCIWKAWSEEAECLVGIEHNRSGNFTGPDTILGPDDPAK